MNKPIFETLIYSVSSQVALITLNRPEVLNAINHKMRIELLRALQIADEDTTIRTIVLTGKGRAFCVGQDLMDNASPGEHTRLIIEEEYKPIILAIDTSPKLIIAAVNGPVAGVGAALSLACDLTIMGSDSYMYQAFSAIGLIPDGGATWQLVHQMGYRRALETVVEGSKLSAQYCVDLGLANRIAPSEDLLQDAMKWAEHLAQKAPLAVRYSKEALKFAQNNNISKTMTLEADLQGKVSVSEDTIEGATAFMEKRKPVFTGK